MINLIRIMEDRSLLISSKVMGVVGENNAEVLKFIFPKKINDINIPDGSLSYKILTENSTNGYVEYDLNNDEFSIPQELTSDETLSFAIGIFQNNSMIWKSFTYCLIFMPGQNTNAESIVRNAVLKLNYDKLYDALAERDIELPEKSTSPTQTDVDGLISIVENLDDGESIRNAILSDIRGSFTENIGGDFTNKTLAQLVGTAQGEPTGDGVIGDDGEFYPTTVPYNDGEIYRIRAAIGYLANLLTEDTIELSGSYQTVNGSISTIEDELDSIKSKIVDCLNSILDPDEPYTTDLTWTSIKDLVDNLPDDVEEIVTQSISADSDILRSQIDLTVDTIIEQYELTIQPVRGSWTNTINNIYAVCAAISELNHGGEISETVISVPFSYIENGITTNLEFTVIDGKPVIKEMEE